MRLFIATHDDNATTVLHGLVRGVKASVTRATVRETLEQHPDFPSLRSMSDALTNWHIDNTALQLNTVEQLRELPLPFIAHLNRKGGWYVLVNALKGDYIHYTDSERGAVTESLADFEKAWTGVVLLAETDEQSGEADYATKHKQERLIELRGPFMLAGAVLIILVVILSVAKDLNAPDWLLLLTKTVGLCISGLLVAKQLGSTNALTDRLCRINANTNCDDVLNSPGAKLWGWLSWADVGLLYFAGGLLTAMLVGVQPALRPLLNVLALLALPYSIFSVYYQGYMIQKWCPLCLGVQGILLIESALAGSQLISLPDTPEPYGLMLVSFLVPILLWIIIKLLLIASVNNHREHEELMRLKRNPNLFHAFLLHQPKMLPIPNDLHPIVLGNPDAEHTITVVTNPYCGPCAGMHKRLSNLILKNNVLKVNIIFAVSNKFENRSHIVSNHLLSLYLKRDDICTALDAWYVSRDYPAWSNLYPVDRGNFDVINKHYNWVSDNKINGTPTVFVNGLKLSIYSIEEVGAMLSYFSDENQCLTNNYTLNNEKVS